MHRHTLHLGQNTKEHSSLFEGLELAPLQCGGVSFVQRAERAEVKAHFTGRPTIFGLHPRSHGKPVSVTTNTAFQRVSGYRVVLFGSLEQTRRAKKSLLCSDKEEEFCVHCILKIEEERLTSPAVIM